MLPLARADASASCWYVLILCLPCHFILTRSSQRMLHTPSYKPSMQETSVTCASYSYMIRKIRRLRSRPRALGSEASYIWAQSLHVPLRWCSRGEVCGYRELERARIRVRVSNQRRADARVGVSRPIPPLGRPGALLLSCTERMCASYYLYV